MTKKNFVSTKEKFVVRDGKHIRVDTFKASIHNGCKNKIKFKTLSAAENYILKIFPEDFTMLPYRCLHCNKYHIGHTKERKRR